MPLIHWLQLAITDGIGPILSRRLIEASVQGRSEPVAKPLSDLARLDLLAKAGGIEAACNADLSLLRSVQGIGSAKASQIQAALRRAADAAAHELEQARALGVTLLSLEDADYPPLLREIPNPPLVLYMKGDLQPRDLNAVAIVGSRKCSHYGREQAERFASLLAGAGVTIISGGARGVDSAAHRGAIRHPDGRTIAVLGCGIDITYPPENKALFEQIAARGAVISEYPIGTQPLAENFPRRNRIVSGMSRGVLVIEADIRSGALITARQAADDHNRPVFAIPGRVDNALSAGPHALIRDGATLVTSLDQILDGLGPLPDSAYIAPDTGLERSINPVPAQKDSDLFPAPAPPPTPLTDRQRTLLDHLGIDPMNIDQLVDVTALPAHQVLQEMTFLTLKGMVKRIDGQTFARTGVSQ